MAIIAYLIGICFFGSLAASGFTLTVQIMYWFGVACMIFVSMGNYLNAQHGMNRLSKNKPLPKDLESILPVLRTIDYDVKCVHVLFSNSVHAVIALQLTQAPILAAFIMISAGTGIITYLKLKEMMKHVENDSRY